MESLLAAEAVPPRRVRPAAPTEAARASVEALLERWDDGAVARLCAMNVDLDEPIARRRRAIERLREVHGRLRPDPSEPTESFSPFHLSWWMAGELGRVQVEIQLSPEREPRVQSLNLTSVPEPSAALAATAAPIVEALRRGWEGEAMPTWPASVALADEVDPAPVRRAFAAAAARFSPIGRATVVGGDGKRTASYRLSGERGAFELRVTWDPDAGRATRIVFVPVNLEPPILAD